MGSHPRRHWNADDLRRQYLRGVTWVEIAEKLNAPSWQSPFLYVKRNTPPDQWPLKRSPEVELRVKSRAMKKAHRSVNPMMIIEMVEEFCDEKGITLNQFAHDYLGWRRGSNGHASKLYAWRSGRIKSMSGPMAAKILRAIGEPVRRDLVA